MYIGSKSYAKLITFLHFTLLPLTMHALHTHIMHIIHMAICTGKYGSRGETNHYNNQVVAKNSVLPTTLLTLFRLPPGTFKRARRRRKRK